MTARMAWAGVSFTRLCLPFFCEPHTVTVSNKIKRKVISLRLFIVSSTSMTLLRAIPRGRILMRDECTATIKTGAARLRRMRRNCRARILYRARPATQLRPLLHHCALPGLRGVAHAAGDERERTRHFLSQRLLGQRSLA